MSNPWTKNYWSGYRRAQIIILRKGLEIAKTINLECAIEQIKTDAIFSKGYDDGIESMRKMLYKLSKKDAEITLNQE